MLHCSDDDYEPRKRRLEELWRSLEFMILPKLAVITIFALDGLVAVYGNVYSHEF